jgi:predicted outer membrane protein
MLYRFMTAGAAVCALTLLGFTGQADATTRLMLKASPALTILAADEENSEVRICSTLRLTTASQAAPPRQRQATSPRPKGDEGQA